jgi:hypothetical protein
MLDTVLVVTVCESVVTSRRGGGCMRLALFFVFEFCEFVQVEDVVVLNGVDEIRCLFEADNINSHKTYHKVQALTSPTDREIVSCNDPRSSCSNHDILPSKSNK